MLFFSLWDLHHYFLTPEMRIEHFLRATSGQGQGAQGSPMGRKFVGICLRNWETSK